MATSASDKPLIVSDFDGTITRQDSLKLLFREFIGEEWLRMEALMESGVWTERKALACAVEQLQISWETAIEFIFQHIEIDSSFTTFVQWVRAEGLDLMILSGGFSGFIEALLGREGLHGLNVRANHVKVEGQSWALNPALGFRLCEEQTHCKCATIKSFATRRIFYIGDGQTDYCPAARSELVFAKSRLKAYCESKGIAFENFTSFLDVQCRIREEMLRTGGQFPARWSQVG